MMSSKMSRVVILSIVLLMMATFASAQMASPNFRIPTSVLDNGGGRESSTNFRVHDSIGQSTAIGLSQSQNFGLFAGFQPTAMEEFDLPSAARGDVNADGSINVLDVLAVINHILGIQPLEGDALWRADCNGDEAINILDALGIVNVILDISECEP